MILLNPGPVTLSARVRAALTKPDLCHREPEFFELQDAIRSRLLDVYELEPAAYAATLLSGSGTAAVEAMIASLVPKGGKLLIVENGVYGERITRIARTYGIDTETLHFQWGEEISMPEFMNRLEKLPGDSSVAVVHHETTTGRLNNIQSLGEACKARGIRVLVDGVSSFGAEEINFTDWGISACAATANKCLHGVPGAAFVILNRALLADSHARSHYFDLANYCRAQDSQGTPFTPAIPAFYALDEALKEFEDAGGWQARHRLYAARMNEITEHLESLGITALLDSGDSSLVLRAYDLPAGTSYEYLHDALKSRGFVIYAGQGQLARKMFRVSLMGEVTPHDLKRLKQAFSDAIR